MENKKEARDVKAWSVKLPEGVIEEIEKLYETSGMKYKNEFLEHLIKQYKENLIKEGSGEVDILHPIVSKTMSGDIQELVRLTKMINELFISQLEKFSVETYYFERAKRELDEKRETIRLLEEMLEKEKRKEEGKNGMIEYIQDSLVPENENMLVLGTSGAGKSYFTKLEIVRSIEEGKRVIIFDFQGEYGRLCEESDIKRVDLSVERLNPMEFQKELGSKELIRKILSVSQIIETLLDKDFTSREKRILLTAIENTYKRFGFNNGVESFVKEMKVPTLKDVNQELRMMADENAIKIADELEPFTFGSANLLSEEQVLDLSEIPSIVFDLSGVERFLLDGVIFTALDYVFRLIRTRDFEKTLFVIDEMWLIARNQKMSEYLSRFLQSEMSMKTNFIFTTQQGRDTLRDCGEMINHYIATKVFFKQHANELEFLKETFELSSEEIAYLKKAKVGETLFVTDSLKAKVKIKENTKIKGLTINPW